MPDENTKFLIDTNLFIAAIKSASGRSAELLIKLIEGPWDLVADDILIAEYERYATALDSPSLFVVVLNREVIVEQSEEDILTCKPFFPPTAAADIVHAAACLHSGAILITNDSHFKNIRDAGIIQVWSISEAIRRLLD